MFIRATVVIVFVLGALVSGCAQTHQVSEPQAQTAAVPKLSREEMMAKWKEYSTPGEEHKALQPMVGSWNHMVQWWPDPDSQPETSAGRSEFKWVMGGRFLEQTVKGKAHGEDFEGRGYLGYDNAAKEYKSVWLDNMGTGLMIGSGRFDPETKTLNEEGLMSCPVASSMPYRGVTTFVNPNHFRYEMFATQPGQTAESKVMNIEYKRRKPRK